MKSKTKRGVSLNAHLLLTSASLPSKNLQNLLYWAVFSVSQDQSAGPKQDEDVKTCLWSVLWNKITTSLRLAVVYEWEKGKEPSFFFHAGINLNFNCYITSSNMQSSNETYFSCFPDFVPLCQYSSFTVHNGTTHRTEDTCKSNYNLDWIQGEAKNPEGLQLSGLSPIQFARFTYSWIFTVLLMLIQHLKLVWIYGPLCSF